MHELNDIPATETGAPTRHLQTSTSNAEDWLRLPKPGGRLNGLSRTTLTELTVPGVVNGFKPPVRSVVIKKRGALRGIRLIDRNSLQCHLDRLADEQRQAARPHNP